MVDPVIPIGGVARLVKLVYRKVGSPSEEERIEVEKNLERHEGKVKDILIFNDQLKSSFQFRIESIPKHELKKSGDIHLTLRLTLWEQRGMRSEKSNISSVTEIPLEVEGCSEDTVFGKLEERLVQMYLDHYTDKGVEIDDIDYRSWKWNPEKLERMEPDPLTLVN